MRPELFCGLAVAAGYMAKRQTAAPEVYVSPPVTSDGRAMAVIRGFTWEVAGVAIQADDGPAPSEVNAGRTLAPLERDSPPWRWWSAQKYALVRRFGAFTGWADANPVPRVTVAQLAAWCDIWSAAHQRWLLADGLFDSDDRERFLPAWERRTAAGTAVARQAVRLHNLIDWGHGAFAADHATVVETQKVLLTYAVAITPGAVESVPLPLPVLVSGWSRVGAAVDEYVIGPVEGAVGAVAGAAGALAVGAAGRVLTSPVGAALILFVVWRYAR